ncbi:MAG: hypothetical protein MI784_16315 [Cytophagales bacterium]|nr:hypothetical protein [Cytophagales bacterium]
MKKDWGILLATNIIFYGTAVWAHLSTGACSCAQGIDSLIGKSYAIGWFWPVSLALMLWGRKFFEK